MKKQQKKSKTGSSSKKRNNNSKNNNDNKERPISWVDKHLDWISNDDGDDSNKNNTDNDNINHNNDNVDDTNNNNNNNIFSIISWNVLADSYCRRNSHKHLPMKYQHQVFDRLKRQHSIKQTLTKFVIDLKVDLLALQEVDKPLGIKQFLKNDLKNYDGIETPTDPAGKDRKVDACGLYYNTTKFNCIESKILRLDDLSTLCSKKITTQSSPSSCEEVEGIMATTSNLQGVQTTFIRKNMALLVKLENKITKQQFVVAVMHLYWNPNYDYVKLCQAHYICQQTKIFANNNNSLPVILCGDFNSKPNGHVHKYLINGQINARLVAPWYNNHSFENQLSYNNNNDDDDDDSAVVSSKPNNINNDDDDVVKVITSNLKERVSIGSSPLPPPHDDDSDPDPDPDPDPADSTPTTTIMNGTSSPSDNNNNNKDNNPKVRYLLDFTLNRFCRWLRILGLDATLETEEEEKLRTKGGGREIAIFDHCIREHRTLVTTSSRLLRRKDCPPGAYLLDTKSVTNVEVALVHMLLSHGVILDPRNFLSRCVVCNGLINQVYDKETIESIFASHQAPNNLNEEIMEVYQCDKCNQGYWWCDIPTSSASRVKNQATKLFEICIRGGVPIKQQDDLGMFDFVDVQKVKHNCPDDAEERYLLDQRLDVLEWLQLENLENPCGPLRNVYSTKDGEETLPFTNVTSDFVGHLDYVMYEPNRLKVEGQLFVPKSFKILAGEEEDSMKNGEERIRNRHCLPSDVWPSDHLAVGGRFSFIDDTKAKEKTLETETIQQIMPSSIKPSRENTTKLDELSTSGMKQDSSETAQQQVEVSFCAPLGTGAPPPAPPPPVVKPVSINHGQRCDCGCVPNVLSLFEMAELRRQAREKKKQQQAEQAQS